MRSLIRAGLTFGFVLGLVAPAHAFSLNLAANGAQFTTGQTATLSVSADNSPGRIGVVDFYVAVLLPDHTTILYLTDLSGGVAVATDIAQMTPVISGVDLSAPFEVTLPDIFSYEWGGAEPAGVYTIVALALTTGAFDDDELTLPEVVAVSTGTVEFAP